ncbi:5528_t:CDS:2, partial [Racocetra fulgida]
GLLLRMSSEPDPNTIFNAKTNVDAYIDLENELSESDSNTIFNAETNVDSYIDLENELNSDLRMDVDIDLDNSSDHNFNIDNIDIAQRAILPNNNSTI